MSYLLIRRSGAAMLAVLCAALAGCGTGRSAAQDEKALAQLQQDLAKAWMARDRATIERIVAPEWTLTGPDGGRSDRVAILAQVFESRVHTILRLEIDDVAVKVFGDAAVVTGRTRGAGAVNGTPYDVVIRFTDTFVRRAGRWQAVASHASLVQ